MKYWQVRTRPVFAQIVAYTFSAHGLAAFILLVYISGKPLLLVLQLLHVVNVAWNNFASGNDLTRISCKISTFLQEKSTFCRILQESCRNPAYNLQNTYARIQQDYLLQGSCNIPQNVRKTCKNRLVLQDILTRLLPQCCLTLHKACLCRYILKLLACACMLC